MSPEIKLWWGLLVHLRHKHTNRAFLPGIPSCLLLHWLQRRLRLRFQLICGYPTQLQHRR